MRVDGRMRFVGVIMLCAFLGTFFLISTMRESELSPRKPPIPGIGRVGVVSVAHDRPEYYRESLKSILEAERVDEVDLIVSMDDSRFFVDLEKVGNEVVKEMGKTQPIVFRNEMPRLLRLISNVDGKISSHHYMILRRGFEEMDYDYLILIESDLIVSKDVFDFFFKVAPYLNRGDGPEDPFCASAWNDNGFEYFKWSESRLFRTDYFPGLGWMIHRSVWMNAWRLEWPHGMIGAWDAFDHWLRDDASTRGRDCIVPEVSRTHHIAISGSHTGSGSQKNWYSKMLLASGNAKIAEVEAGLVAGNMNEYEARLRRERIDTSVLVRLDKVPDQDPEKGKNFTYVVDPEMVPALNERFKWFSGRLRSSHKGLFTCELGPEHALTNLTVILSTHIDYWYKSKIN